MPGGDANPLADLALIRAAAREAGSIALRYFKAKPEVWWKGHSPVSEADFAVDRFLKETLTAARPDYGWLSEETTDTPDRLAARRTFVVDPIDGTRAFLDGQNTWCVSIAVVEDGRSIAGVLDCPAKERVFEAAIGAGALLNDRRITVAAPGPSPLIAGPRPMLDGLAGRLSIEMRRSAYIPSLAYRLAMVACGELDATFVKQNSHDWDLAAADLILGEAGGAVVDASGQPLHYAGPDPAHGVLAAGSGALLDLMITTIGHDRGTDTVAAVPKPAELL